MQYMNEATYFAYVLYRHDIIYNCFQKIVLVEDKFAKRKLIGIILASQVA